jgi:hypothetical protein
VGRPKREQYGKFASLCQSAARVGVVAIKRVKLSTTGEDAGKRLDELLSERLLLSLGRPVSKAKGRELIMAGDHYPTLGKKTIVVEIRTVNGANPLLSSANPSPRIANTAHANKANAASN